MAFTYVTVTHTFEDADDTAARGYVEFTPVAAMRNTITVVAAPVKAGLTTGGAISQVLASNTDPDTTPTGTTYKVTELLAGQPPLTYYIQVPHNQGSTLDLRALAGWQGAPSGSGGGGTGTGSVNSVNGIDPDGGGNVTLSASDVGAQLASAALTRLAANPVTLTAVSGTITPNAAAGTWFRYDATAAVTLAEPTGPSDGQPLHVQVYASGADRVLTLPNGLDPVTITAGRTWWGQFSYVASRTEWLLTDGLGGAVVGGSSYTDEQVDDRVNALIVAGSNITKVYDDATGTLTISAATTGSAGIPATIVDAKGDLVGASAPDTPVRVPGGTVDGQVLIRDSTPAAGLSWSNGGAPAVHAVGNSGTALTLDASAAAGYVKTVTLNANCTFTLSGAASARAATLELVLTQDATGGRTVTWPATVKWSGGAPTLSTTAGSIDRVVLTSYNGGSTWCGDLVGKGYV